MVDFVSDMHENLFSRENHPIIDQQSYSHQQSNYRTSDPNTRSENNQHVRCHTNTAEDSIEHRNAIDDYLVTSLMNGIPSQLHTTEIKSSNGHRQQRFMDNKKKLRNSASIEFQPQFHQRSSKMDQHHHQRHDRRQRNGRRRPIKHRPYSDPSVQNLVRDRHKRLRSETYQMSHSTSIHFNTCFSLLEELFDKMNIELSSDGFRFLDIACAPGGFSQFLLDGAGGRSSCIQGFGITLPPELGGFEVMIDPHGHTSPPYHLFYFDLLSPPSSPLPSGVGSADVVIADAQYLPGKEFQQGPYKGTRLLDPNVAKLALLINQFRIAFEALRDTGMFLFRFSALTSLSENAFRLIMLCFDLFESIRPFKSEYVHCVDLSFYLVCRGFNRKQYIDREVFQSLSRGYSDLFNAFVPNAVYSSQIPLSHPQSRSLGVSMPSELPALHRHLDQSFDSHQPCHIPQSNRILDPTLALTSILTPTPEFPGIPPLSTHIYPERIPRTIPSTFLNRGHQFNRPIRSHRWTPPLQLVNNRPCNSPFPLGSSSTKPFASIHSPRSSVRVAPITCMQSRPSLHGYGSPPLDNHHSRHTSGPRHLSRGGYPCPPLSSRSTNCVLYDDINFDHNNSDQMWKTDPSFNCCERTEQNERSINYFGQGAIPYEPQDSSIQSTRTSTPETTTDNCVTSHMDASKKSTTEQTTDCNVLLLEPEPKRHIACWRSLFPACPPSNKINGLITMIEQNRRHHQLEEVQNSHPPANRRNNHQQRTQHRRNQNSFSRNNELLSNSHNEYNQRAGNIKIVLRSPGATTSSLILNSSSPPTSKAPPSAGSVVDIPNKDDIGIFPSLNVPYQPSSRKKEWASNVGSNVESSSESPLQSRCPSEKMRLLNTQTLSEPSMSELPPKATPQSLTEDERSIGITVSTPSFSTNQPPAKVRRKSNFSSSSAESTGSTDSFKLDERGHSRSITCLEKREEREPAILCNIYPVVTTNNWYFDKIVTMFEFVFRMVAIGESNACLAWKQNHGPRLAAAAAALIVTPLERCADSKNPDENRRKNNRITATDFPLLNCNDRPICAPPLLNPRVQHTAHLITSSRIYHETQHCSSPLVSESCQHLTAVHLPQQAQHMTTDVDSFSHPGSFMVSSFSPRRTVKGS